MTDCGWSAWQEEEQRRTLTSHCLPVAPQESSTVNRLEPHTCWRGACPRATQITQYLHTQTMHIQTGQNTHTSNTRHYIEKLHAAHAHLTNACQTQICVNIHTPQGLSGVIRLVQLLVTLYCGYRSVWIRAGSYGWIIVLT